MSSFSPGPSVLAPGLAGRILVSICLACCGFLFSGCEEHNPQSPVAEEVSERPDPMRMLVIGDDRIGELIVRQWSAQRDGDLTVVNQTSSEFADGNFEIDPGINIVLYPPGFLGELESRDKLQLISKSLWNSEVLNKNELLRHHRTTLVRHSNETWAIPLGSPQFCLVYNADVLAKLKLPPPKTWEQLVELANLLQATEDLQDDQGNPLPTAFDLPLAEGWAAEVFLARASPLIRSLGRLSTVFNRETMAPLIVQPPFERALVDVKAMLGARSEQLSFSPAEVYQRLLKGESAIGITWPSRAFVDENFEKTTRRIEVASLPGSPQWYDYQSENWVMRSEEIPSLVELVGFTGLVASVTQASRNTSWAFDFLEWLGSKPTNLITAVESPLSGPFRASHLGDPTRWTGDQLPEAAAQQYADAVRTCNDHAIVFMFPRIPGRQQYVQVLDQQVRNCLEGKSEPPAALARVAEEWEKITDAQGRNRQKTELRKDVGL